MVLPLLLWLQLVVVVRPQQLRLWPRQVVVLLQVVMVVALPLSPAQVSRGVG